MGSKSGLACAQLLVMAAVANLGGCPVFWDEGADFLVGVNGTKAYIEQYDAWSGFETLPSRVWEFDLTTGERREVVTARVQYDTQAVGDYVVAERPTDDDQGSRIVAFQISTGDTVTIQERAVPLGGRYYQVFVLEGQRVVALTDAGLLVYDLAARQIARQINVDPLPEEIYAVGGAWALVSTGATTGTRLVNLETDEVVTVPAEPTGWHALFFDAALQGDVLFTGAYEAGDDITPTGNAVLALDIATLTWSTLVDYGAPSGTQAWSVTPSVCGADATRVVVAVTPSVSSARLETVERASGQRTEIVRQTGLLASPFLARLIDGKVYWLDDWRGTLVTYDLAIGQMSSVQHGL